MSALLAHHASMMAASADASDPYWSNVAALLRFDGTDGSTSIVDEIGTTWTAQGAAQLDTDQAAFGPSSLVLSGATGTRVYADGSLFINPAGGEDYTVEGFIRPASLPGSSTDLTTIISTRNAGTSGWVMYLRGDGRLRFIAYSTGLEAVDILASSEFVSIDSWHHFALTKQGTDWRLFCNGVLVGTVSAPGSPSAGVGNATAHIGWDGTSRPGRHFAGHIDEIRVTKGVARYTSGFAPPAAPWPSG